MGRAVKPRMRRLSGFPGAINRTCDQTGIGPVKFQAQMTASRAGPLAEIGSFVPRDSDISLWGQDPGWAQDADMNKPCFLFSASFYPSGDSWSSRDSSSGRGFIAE